MSGQTRPAPGPRYICNGGGGNRLLGLLLPENRTKDSPTWQRLSTNLSWQGLAMVIGPWPRYIGPLARQISAWRSLLPDIFSFFFFFFFFLLLPEKTRKAGSTSSRAFIAQITRQRKAFNFASELCLKNQIVKVVLHRASSSRIVGPYSYSHQSYPDFGGVGARGAVWP